MAHAIVNEKSAGWLTVSFQDKDGDPEAPASVTYRIDDVISGNEIRADTVLTPAASIEIDIEPDDTVILDSNHSSEERRVTVQASYGAIDKINDAFTYLVRNLQAVT